MTDAILVRSAEASDRDAIVALVPRLRAFGEVPLRPPESLDRAEREALERALVEPPADSTILVAELGEAGVVGVAFALTVTDYFTRERHGHLSVIAVSSHGEGKGVGRALLAATEKWSASLGHRFLTLNVFASNERARSFYERAGFAPDTLRYFKEHHRAAQDASGPLEPTRPTTPR